MADEKGRGPSMQSLYYTFLLFHGVPEDDAARNARAATETTLREFFRTVPFEGGIHRLRELNAIGENTRDPITTKHLEDMGNLGVAIYTLADYTAGTINGFLRSERTFVTISDLVHPHPQHKHQASLNGSYVLSEMLGLDLNDSLGTGLSRAIYDLTIQRTSLDEAQKSLDSSLLAISEVIKPMGWRGFIPKVLLPLRQQTAKYYPSLK